MRLSGKTVVMTAAGAGIGRACAQALAAEGATVHATDIDRDALASLAAERIICAPLDVTDRDAIIAYAETVPTPDTLFNCAGYVHHGTLLDTDEDAWEHTLTLNLRGTARMTRAFLPRMIANGGGSIINMGSVVSSMTAAANRCAYGASKGAILGLTKSIALDFIHARIRCNAVCPGTVMTPSLQARMAAQGDYETALEAMRDRQPTRELAQPEDIAPIVVYLASDESKRATGQFFTVDGGWTI